MCGIGGVFTREPLPDIDNAVQFMARVQSHRGPDLQATFITPDRRSALSHDRLSIVDLSPAADQPLTDETGALQLVCNGEIYNHRALRAELEAKGHRFRSHSDCEVILHLYQEHGEELLPKLRGMYAFILLDTVNHTVFAARDRLGKKPLVYAETDRGVAMASELPALRAFEGIDWSVSPESLGLFLLRNVRHIPDPMTFYRGVRRLNPGHAMTIARGRITRIWKYWHPEYKYDEPSIEQLLAVFDEAVALRRIADVEVAALLSGGVDSSAIVQATIAQGSKGIRTYAMGRDADDEELVRARRVAKLLGTDHREFYFDADREHAQYEELLAIHGEPIMLLPLAFAYELCRNIRADGIRVVLAGHGADETFYGYSGHENLAMISRFLPFVPALARPMLSTLAQRMPDRSAAREAMLVAASAPGDRKAALYRDEATTLWKLLLTPLESTPQQVIGAWLETWMNGNAPPYYIDEASIIGLMHENSHSVTIAGDLPAMAASVEVRCPFLDQELVEMAWRIPFWKKTERTSDHSRNKKILKVALAGRLPHDVLYAPKRGFGYHIQEESVLRGPWKRQVDAEFADLHDLGGWLNRDAARNLKRDFDAQRSVPAILIAKLYAASRAAKAMAA